MGGDAKLASFHPTVERAVDALQAVVGGRTMMQVK